MNMTGIAEHATAVSDEGLHSFVRQLKQYMQGNLAQDVFNKLSAEFGVYIACMDFDRVQREE